jgi:2-polyprenyl-6-methoxyphenol hydroxylase-like FAD-dependent oxidoreductase
MNQARKAIVVGGSLGGLFAANLLLRDGWDVHVYEREGQDMAGRGAGIVTHPELMHALAQAGVVVDDSLGVNIVERIALGQDGKRVGSRTMPQLFTSWGRMFQALRSVFPDDRYHHGMPVTGFAQDSTSVSVTFADGSAASADLLVATDGVRSTLRQVLLPQATLMYAGYVAWRGTVEESALSAQAMKDVFPYFAFGLPPHEQLVAYPIAGHDHRVDVGHRRYNFVWYRPVDEATTLQDLMTDASGKLWPDGIPPPLIRPEILRSIRQVARDVLAPQFAELIEKTESLFFQPIYDMASTQLAFGRIALLGDAAFVARPHCGMGVAKAAGDALELVRALRDHDSIEAAIKAYEVPRLGLGQRTITQARHLGAYLQAQISTPMEREMAERYRAPDIVLAETALPLA